MARHELQLVHGGRDVVDVLEHHLERAKAGEIEIVIVVTVDTDNMQKWAWAYVEGIAVPWARMVAAVAGVQHDLMTGDCL